MHKFRLQRVLELREKRQDDAATDLATAREAAARALEAARTLELQQRTHLEQVAAVTGGGVSVGQLQNLSLLVQRLGDQVDDAYRVVDSTELQVRERLAQFASAFRDRQVLAKLKQKDLDAWRTAEASADRAAMDDVALSQFVRAARTATAGEKGK
jgi:flagellar protein FliJ